MTRSSGSPIEKPTTIYTGNLANKNNSGPFWLALLILVWRQDVLLYSTIPEENCPVATRRYVRLYVSKTS
jgi:hypothetical protein